MAEIIVSNNIGPNKEPVDRIYGNPNGSLRLVQADYTTYKGSISKKTITKENHLGERYKTYVYVTDDNRWFDRGGIPILPPEQIQEDDDGHDS